MLLEALVACAGVTLNAVATALGIELRNASLQAEGDLDFRGTLGLSKEVPVGFRDIRLKFTLDTDATVPRAVTNSSPSGSSTVNGKIDVAITARSPGSNSSYRARSAWKVTVTVQVTSSRAASVAPPPP